MKPVFKFTLDMLFGIAKSQSILLFSNSYENTKKINTVNRLSDNLNPICLLLLTIIIFISKYSILKGGLYDEI